MLELGPIGFVLWYGLRFSVFVAAMRCSSVLRGTALRKMALILAAYHLTILDAGIVFDVTNAVYYWFFAVLIFLLPSFERSRAGENGAGYSRKDSHC